MLKQDRLAVVRAFSKGVIIKEKVRNGTRLTRRHDKPKTACQRVLESPDINPGVKEKLRKRFLTLNPKRLLLEITRLGRNLVKK